MKNPKNQLIFKITTSNIKLGFRRYPRLKPRHSKQFKLRLTPLGDYTFTHGQARGTLPFGLLEALPY